MAKVTIFGLMAWDPTLFDDIKIPDGMEKDLLISEIQLRCADYEMMYPDAEFMKVATINFFRSHYLTFFRWWEAINMEYDPLYNYDRFEDLSDTTNDKGSSKSTSGNTVKQKVSAFDSSTMQPNSETEDSGTVNVDNANDRTYKATNHIYGNIGVTTSSAMLEEYIKTQQINIYERIAELYATNFCLMVE